jgi:hypothetical protein
MLISFCSKISASIPFISFLRHICSLFSQSFGSLCLSDICSSPALYHIIWRSSCSLAICCLVPQFLIPGFSSSRMLLSSSIVWSSGSFCI